MGPEFDRPEPKITPPRAGAGTTAAARVAGDPFVVPNLRRSDEEGREIGDLLIDDFLFNFCVDHAAKVMTIVEVDDAS